MQCLRARLGCMQDLAVPCDALVILAYRHCAYHTSTPAPADALTPTMAIIDPLFVINSELLGWCIISDDYTLWHRSRVLLRCYAQSVSMSRLLCTPQADPHLPLPLPSRLAVPKGLTAAGGIDTLVHAIESYVSIFATDYTKASSCGIICLSDCLNGAV